jgi:hypothetical protein
MLRSKRDAGAVHEHDDIRQRRACDRAGKRNADCLFDLHVGPAGLRFFNGTSISAPYTRVGDDGSKIESNDGQKENHLSP